MKAADAVRQLREPASPPAAITRGATDRRHRAHRRISGSLILAVVLDALNMAAWNRRPETGLVHHSDRGCQYTSLAFGRRCREAGILPSMGSCGDAYDNALAESSFATLDTELLTRQSSPIRGGSAGDL